MATTRVIRLPGGLRVEAAGESFYVEAIEAVLSELGAGSGRTEVWASLVPDPANPYDRNAVKVMIHGKHVGHLGRDAAVAFRPVAERIRKLGCEAQCAATISGRSGVWGVVLDLGAPDDCLRALS